jgi:hypothetical protein
MTTNNSYHILNENDDLLFNEEENFGIPIIIPPIAATAENYFTVPDRDSRDMAKKRFIAVELNLVLDQNMIFRTKTLK